MIFPVVKYTHRCNETSVLRENCRRAPRRSDGDYIKRRASCILVPLAADPRTLHASEADRPALVYSYNKARSSARREKRRPFFCSHLDEGRASISNDTGNEAKFVSNWPRTGYV